MFVTICLHVSVLNFLLQAQIPSTNVAQLYNIVKKYVSYGSVHDMLVQVQTVGEEISPILRIFDARKCGCLAPGSGRLTSRKCMVSITQKDELASGQVWTATENLPPFPHTEIRSAYHLTRGEPLYLILMAAVTKYIAQRNFGSCLSRPICLYSYSYYLNS